MITFISKCQIDVLKDGKHNIGHYVTYLHELREHFSCVETTMRHPCELSEHLNAVIKIETNIIPIKPLKITEEKVLKSLQKIKKKKAPGPNKLKLEFYKPFTKSEQFISYLTMYFQNEYYKEDKHEE